MQLSEGHRRGQKRRQRAKVVKAAKAFKAKRDAEKRLKAFGERKSKEVYDPCGCGCDPYAGADLPDIQSALWHFCWSEALDPDLAIVGAGAAMYLHGLRGEVNDIDFFHPDLVGTPHRKVQFRGWELDFGGFALPPECLDFVVIGGVRVQSHSGLLAFYRRLNREKDQASIALLEQLV